MSNYTLVAHILLLPSLNCIWHFLYIMLRNPMKICLYSSTHFRPVDLYGDHIVQISELKKKKVDCAYKECNQTDGQTDRYTRLVLTRK